MSESKNSLAMKEIFERLKNQFSDKEIVGFYDPAAAPADPKLKRGGDCYVQVQPEAIVKVAAFLRDQSELFFNSLMCLSGLEEGGDQPGYSVVYHLHSLRHRHRVTLKVRVAKEKASVPSVTSVWNAANWFEREAFDLIGIRFENHPDLRRILLPSDWVGHPLRKDYEFPKEYNGISCERAKLK